MEPYNHSDLVRAVSQACQPKPDWFKQQSAVYSPTYGRGRVLLLLGNFASVRFDQRTEPVEFPNWRVALANGTLSPPQANTATTSADLADVPTETYQQLVQDWEPDLKHIDVTPPRDGQYEPIPDNLAPPLQRALTAMGITQLYRHQVEAYRTVADGGDLVLTTGVNSGKSLGFTLPILDGALKYRHTTLMIVPANQLMEDQFDKLADFMAQTDTDLVCGKIHGGVPQRDRIAMFRDEPDVLLINPDCLNTLISKIREPQYRQFNVFLHRLRYLVLDEGHEMDGVLGAHVASLLMRLRVAIHRLAGDPWSLQYIVCSATVSNEAELANLLTQRNHPVRRPSIRVIDDTQNGAPNPGRVTLIFNHEGNTASTVTRLAEKVLTETDLVGITFFNSRNGSKKLMEALGRVLKRSQQDNLTQTVKLFNSSVDQQLKRQTIAGIKDGSVRLVFATSSLQAGVDLAQLDYSVVWGFPRLCDLRQRWGRAGRGERPGLCVFIPGSSNLDYYYVRHPEQLLHGTVEAALLDPHYAVRLAQHLLSAAAESGLRAEEISLFFGPTAEVIAGELLQQGRLMLSRNGEDMYATGRPYLDIAIRGNRPNTIKLLNSATGETLETLSYRNAIMEVFPGAVYKVQNAQGDLQQFRSSGLKTETNTVQLTPMGAAGRFTQPLEDSALSHEHVVADKVLQLGDFGTLTLTLDWSKVTSSVIGYQEWEAIQVLSCETDGCRKRSVEVSGRRPRCEVCNQKLRLKEVKQDLLAQVDFAAEAIQTYTVECPTITWSASDVLRASLFRWVKARTQAVKAEHKDKLPFAERVLLDSDPVVLGVHSFLHALIVALPLGDRYSTQDVNDLVLPTGQGVDMVCVLSDTADGGTGATEYVFEHIRTVAGYALKLSQECECGDVGCPRCLTHTSCAKDNEGLYKRLGMDLLSAYLATEQTPTVEAKTESDSGLSKPLAAETTTEVPTLIELTAMTKLADVTTPTLSGVQPD